MESELSGAGQPKYPDWRAPYNPEFVPDKIEIGQVMVRELRQRIDACKQLIEEYKQRYKGQIEGQANFIDISLNRLGLCQSDLRVLENPSAFDPEDLPDIGSVERCVRDLETYLDLCGKHKEFFEKECTKSGFSPDLNREADTLAQKGELKLNGISTTRIHYYIRKSQERLNTAGRSVPVA